MAHEIEIIDGKAQLMYAGDVPWHGLGNHVAEAQTSEEAIKLAGLDWRVEKMKMQLSFDYNPEGIDTPSWYQSGIPIPNQVANVRMSDGKILGVVGEDYTVIQNSEAFDFSDSLISWGKAKYETAGSLRGGKTVFMCIRLSDVSVLGVDSEGHQHFLLMISTHDGTGKFRIVDTLVRAVCMNTVNLAVKSAHRSWGTKHTGILEDKLFEAERTLELSERYVQAYQQEAEKLANTFISNDRFVSILGNLFPIPEDAKASFKRNRERDREDLTSRLHTTPDLKPFVNTGWGVVQAVSDFVYHRPSLRDMDPRRFQEKRLETAIDGSDLLDQAKELVLAGA